VKPPDGVRDGLAAMLRDEGLLYCSADFIVDGEGRWHFIDLNPCGQYGWIELKCGLPISAAIHGCLSCPVSAESPASAVHTGAA
jgi:hypothetical protein